MEELIKLIELETEESAIEAIIINGGEYCNYTVVKIIKN